MCFLQKNLPIALCQFIVLKHILKAPQHGCSIFMKFGICEASCNIRAFTYKLIPYFFFQIGHLFLTDEAGASFYIV